MSTSKATVEYILEQLAPIVDVRVRSMFGEYALYCFDRVVGLICDDEVFIKTTEAGQEYAAGRYVVGTAYPGAKPSMNISDSIDDADFFCELVRITANALPPKKRT
jgi:TfoX/Sxy family transcriptional regulator of competence genes